MESDKASTRNVVIDFLLNEHYLLTAFELYHELLEDGHAAAAVKLHSFFSDAETFPPEQMRALQNIDAQLLADEKEAASEKAAVTEYELRLAREDIASLQEKLESFRQAERITMKANLVSSLAEHHQEGDNLESCGNGSDSANKTVSYPELKPMGDMERRDLSSAVREYLVSAGYKLTAITLEEELDQDLDSWPNQVPEALRRYYLAFLSSTAEAVEERSTLKAENAVLLNAKMELEQEVSSVSKSFDDSKKDASEKDRQLRQLKESLSLAERQLNEFRSEVTTLKLELEGLMANRYVETRKSEMVSQESFAVGDAQSQIDANVSTVAAEEKEIQIDRSENAGTAGALLEPQTDQSESIGAASEDRIALEANAIDIAETSGTENSTVLPPAALALGSLISSSSTAADQSVSSLANGPTTDAGGGGLTGLVASEELISNEKQRDSNDQRRSEDTNLQVVRILADALPRIVPYVLINYREELLPLIICAIELHPDDLVRDALTHTLFNLIKKPDENQRRVIMDACLTLAKNVGEVRTETELLPQCWEQIDHKYEERRILVAQSCGELGRFVRPDMRTSLILSIVQQLMEDEANVVREAAALNLALLVPLFPNLDRFSKVEEMMFQFVTDPAVNVVDTTLEQLVPAVVRWAKYEKDLIHHIMSVLLSRLVGTVQRCPPLSPVQDSLEFLLRDVGPRERWVTGVLLRLLIVMLPEIRRLAFRSCPFPDIFFEDEEDLESFFSDELLKLYSMANVEWPDFDWLPEDCFPAVLHVATLLSANEEGLMTQLVQLLRTVSKLFGSTYLTSIVLPIFLMASGDFADTSHLSSRLANRIKGFKPLSPKAEHLARACVLPLLLAGVLGSPNMTEGSLGNYLRDSVLQSSLNHGSRTTIDTPELIDAVRFLCTFREHLDVIVGVLWDLVVNPNASVKTTAVSLFKVLVPYVDLKLATQQVLPALVTLGSDTDLNVRYASIEAFGAVAQHFKDESVVDKIKVQMDGFLDDDGSHEATIAVIRALAAAVPLTSPALREYLMQKLLALSGATNLSTNLTRRIEKVDAFCEAIRALDATDIPANSVKDLLLPAIQNLMKDMDALDPAHKEALEVIVKERGGGLRLDVLSKHLKKTSMGGLFGEGGYLGGSSVPATPTTPAISTIPENATIQPTPPQTEGRLKFWRPFRGTTSE